MSLYYMTMSPWERLKKRPGEHVLALIMVIVGTWRLFVGEPLVQDIDSPLVALAWSLLALVGGVAILAGLQWRMPTWSRAIERIGWTFASVTILGGALYVVWATRDALTMSLFIGLVDDGLFAVAGGLRWLYLREETIAARKARELVTEQKVREDGE